MKQPLVDRLLNHAERLQLAIQHSDELAIADALEAERALILEAAERIRALEQPGVLGALRRAFGT